MPPRRPSLLQLAHLRGGAARRALGCVLLALPVAACSSATAPQNGGTHAAGLTHPAGVIAAVDTLAGTPYDAAISKDGVVLAAMMGSNILRRGSLSSMGFTDSVAVGDAPLQIVIDRAGATAFAVLRTGDAVAVVDIASNSVKATIPLTSAGTNVILAPDGSRLYATTSAGALFVIDAITNAVLDTLEVGPTANGLAFNVDGSMLYVSLGDSATVTAIDAANDQIVRTYQVSGAAEQLAVSPDGRTLYVANDVSTLDVLDLGTGHVTPLQIGTAGSGLALTPDGAQLYLLLPNLGEGWILDRATLQVRDTLHLGGRPRSVSFDPTGDVAAITNEQSVTFVH
jgi:DNA-binding beta-propeller fold protein YncE